MKSKANRPHRIRRWLKRNAFWAIACAILLTIIILQSRPPRHIPVPPIAAIHDLPAYARQPVVIPDDVRTVGEYIKTLSDQAHVKIDVKWPKTVTDFKYSSPDFPAPPHPEKCILAEAISRLLDATNGNFSAEYDPERVIVGTFEDIHVSQPKMTFVYPISDLLVVDDPRVETISRDDRIRAIEYAIEGSVEPEAWKNYGGTIASVSEFNGKLIIIATPTMHTKIQRLLDALRQR